MIERWVTKFCQRLLGLARWQKKVILILNDLILLAFSLWFCVSIDRGSVLSPLEWSGGLTFIGVPILGALIYQYFGSYKQVTRYFNQFGINQIFLATAFSTTALTVAVYAAGSSKFPYSIILSFGLLSGFLLVLSRKAMGYLLLRTENKTAPKDQPTIPVMIYGAGEAGLQLSDALSKNSEYRIAGFIDDRLELWRQRIGGLKVYPPNQISDVLKRENVQEIFLAIPSLKRSEKRIILQNLMHNQIAVKSLPALSDLASGKVRFSDLRSINIEDLLGRESVQPVPGLLQKSVTGKIILVTGAGGSIGSELVRQIYKLKPEKLILLEQSENALYHITSELEDAQRNIARSAVIEKVVDIESVLGSVLDTELVDGILRSARVNTIFHAAAYKHVPLVEHNPMAGILNNTFGTKVVAELAVKHNVEEFILISTDKAVRPTNVMGASKRLAEMILQALAHTNQSKTVFAMVRFGNVLGSSGSVVPRFKAQIAHGGPVTITHRNMERYFMSIPEAVQLVIQTAALAESGGVYVLDMGEPVKISDLAKAMIELSGLTIKDTHNPNGDIAIEYSGLRDGEKLKEELLINNNAVGTEHPWIVKSYEPFLEWPVLLERLNEIESANSDIVFDLLTEIVEGYSNKFTERSKRSSENQAKPIQ